MVLDIACDDIEKFVNFPSKRIDFFDYNFHRRTRRMKYTAGWCKPGWQSAI